MSDGKQGRSRTVKETIVHSLKNVTPARLGFLMFVNIFLAALFCLVAVNTIQQHEHAVKTVGLDAAPSVISAYGIKTDLSVMDLALANQLLRLPNSDDSKDDTIEFENGRVDVSRELVVAAKNITYGAKEQTPIENLQITLGKYLLQAQEARDLHKLGKPEALLAYGASLESLEGELLPNADKLEKENSNVLETTYAHEKSATNLSRGLVVLLGWSLIGALGYTQIFLIRRFHRRVCLPIAFAMICIFVVLNHMNSSLAENSNALKIAKEDAYDSVLALLSARANAYHACAAASRWLVDHKNAAEYEAKFTENIFSIAKFTGEHNITDTIATAEKELKSGGKISLPGFEGALAKELSNIRFPEEANTAICSLKEFAAYCQADNKMRELYKTSPSEASHMCLSYGPSGERFPFNKFDNALIRITQISMSIKV